VGFLKLLIFFVGLGRDLAPWFPGWMRGKRILIGWGGEAAQCCKRGSTPPAAAFKYRLSLFVGWQSQPEPPFLHCHSRRHLFPFEKGETFFADRILIFGLRRNRAKDYLKATLGIGRVSTSCGLWLDKPVPEINSLWREGFGRLLRLCWKSCQHFGKAAAVMSSSANSSSGGTAGNPTFKAVGISLAVGSG